MLDTTIRKQTQIIIKQAPYKQLELKTNQTWFLCGNRKDISTQNVNIVNSLKEKCNGEIYNSYTYLVSDSISLT